MAKLNLAIVETEGHGPFKRVALVGRDGYELYAGNGPTIDDAREALLSIACSYIACSYMIGASVLDLTKEEVEA